jgi:general stress protein CsbA
MTAIDTVLASSDNKTTQNFFIINFEVKCISLEHGKLKYFLTARKKKAS